MAGVILPTTQWRAREGLDALCRTLGSDAGEVRFVGGAVRDALLGIEAVDVDLATVHAPDAVIARLKAAGIRAVPTGIAHGTITAVLPSGPVEVTTLRRDVATDGRHATVAFTDDWQADAARRDFTINALYADPRDGAVVDYFDGLADLAARRVRFIGAPLERIAEDHLRILRFFRFQARFGTAIDAEGLAACTARANDLMALSRERIAAELLRLLVAPHAVAIVRLMIEHGIFRPVLPEITDPARFERVVAREAAAGMGGDAVRRLAALLPADAVEEVGARLKLSNADRKRMLAAVQPLPDAAPRVLLYRLGRTGAEDRLLLSDLDDDAVLSALAAVESIEAPVFPISGGAIVAQGVRKGPEVARLLRAVEERWIAEDFPGAARLDQLVAQVIGDWRDASIA